VRGGKGPKTREGNVNGESSAGSTKQSKAASVPNIAKCLGPGTGSGAGCAEKGHANPQKKKIKGISKGGRQKGEKAAKRKDKSSTRPTANNTLNGILMRRG